jgi:hypothetical protein
MRKLSVLVVLVALAAAPAALAKERNIGMIGAPVAPKAGQAWTATLRVAIDGKPVEGVGPMVRIVNQAGKTTFIPSKPTAKTGIYRARIVFPTAGTWRVIVVDRNSGRSYEFNRMKVRPA